MIEYLYTAKQGTENSVEGTIQAKDISDAVRQIIKMGLAPVDVVPKLEKIDRSMPGRLDLNKIIIKRVSFHELVLFTRQMSDLLEASVPVLRILKIIESQTPNIHLRKIILEIHDAVQNGNPLSESLAQFPRYFSLLYVNLVKTGEATGQLDSIFNRLAEYLETEEKIRGRIAVALAYPLLLFSVGCLMFFILLIWVVPRLTTIFDDFDRALPLPTIVVMTMSDLLIRWGWALAILFVTLGIYIKKWMDTPSGRRQVDQFILQSPFVGNFVTMTETAGLVRTWGALVAHGVTVPHALSVSQTTVRNVVLKEGLKKALENITKGSSLNSALRQCPFFPEVARHMIAVAEETGNLEKAFLKVADILDRQTDEAVSKITSLIGPLALLVVVGLIGLLMMAILLPILRINTLIQ